ncbi:ABC transporter ATP-binding protein [Pedobacter psychrophilus]|uniref:ABC transporter ATP-binding protein n=1 Tax=Pedobacter psychrophilus TaxID=1826909 RepID=A0A179DE57_9SPHI|nr:ATP-binding cassette domain-containing protein [Pedobacter psychrophilus]OAQ39335.1 ABC transporter ATP-binding protein [Pedobacter psychrophilus]
MVTDDIIKVENLSFSFGQQKVLNNISLNVPKGSVYGFLGPNGSGKTTTIKLLLNLLQNHENNIFLFGKEIKANREDVLKKVGSLIEGPALYHHLSGFDNLKARAIILGINNERINDILSIVGLTDAAKKKAGKYSLGMKQRLGIGLALLSDPELLILDEPTNGLDPNGIIEIRNLIKKLSIEHQKTIFISSHLLAEIERIATHVGILYQGNLSFEGKIEDLQSLAKSTLCVDTDDNLKAATILNINYEVLKDDKRLRIPYESPEQAAAINKLLIQNDISVYNLFKEKKDLESLFLDITQTV